jgi:hypothetical protein
MMMVDLIDVLGAETTDGELRIKVGDAAKSEGFSAGHRMFGTGGFISVPNPPANGQACQALVLRDGHEKLVIGTADNRFTDKVGELAPGDNAIISDCSSRLMHKQAADVICLYAENADAGGQAMIVSIDAANGVLLLQNGGAYIQLKKDEIAMAVSTASASAGLRLSKDGVQMSGAAVQALAGAEQLGDMGGGVIVPAVPTNAVALGPGGPVNVTSAKVFAALLLALVLFSQALLYRGFG